MDSRLDLALSVAKRLGDVEGVIAVVLGGSRARGDADAHSDVDLGIYYRPERPPSLYALRALARELDDRHPAEALTDFGGWGPWVNGGGWLRIDGVSVDVLYRDLARVSQVIAECRVGRSQCHYQAGHPHGFHSHFYMGEVHYAQPLHDPEEAFAALQAATVPYPPALQRTLVDGGLWEAGFSLEGCAKSAPRGDVHHVSGMLFRASAGLVQALFAHNERYLINEKRSLPNVASLGEKPERFTERLQAVLAAPGRTPDELRASVAQVSQLLDETRAVCGRAR